MSSMRAFAAPSASSTDAPHADRKACKATAHPALHVEGCRPPGHELSWQQTVSTSRAQSSIWSHRQAPEAVGKYWPRFCARRWPPPGGAMALSRSMSQPRFLSSAAYSTRSCASTERHISEKLSKSLTTRPLATMWSRHASRNGGKTIAHPTGHSCGTSLPPSQFAPPSSQQAELTSSK